MSMFPVFSNVRTSNNLPEVFCKKIVLCKLVKFAGKYLCLSLFFDKVVGLGNGLINVLMPKKTD